MSVYDSEAASAARLTKKLRRFFNEVRREARRNPSFAAKLEAALDATRPDDAIALLPEDAAAFDAPEEAASDPAMELNPVAIARREGAEGLRATIQGMPETALRGLIAEHNLDPAGETGRLRRDALVDHIVAQASKRIARDTKLFEY